MYANAGIVGGAPFPVLLIIALKPLTSSIITFASLLVCDTTVFIRHTIPLFVEEVHIPAVIFKPSY